MSTDDNKKLNADNSEEQHMDRLTQHQQRQISNYPKQPLSEHKHIIIINTKM